MRGLPLVVLLVVTMLAAERAPAAADQRVEQTDRPKIGLALSGGGARGGAHIGVLKALEELQIPVDYIVGTSMGAIIGALYASGYSPDEIETIITETNWVEAFSDQSDRRAMTMRKKQLDADFLIPHRVGFNHGKIQLPLGVIEGQRLDLIFQRAFEPVKDVHDFDKLAIPFRAVATDLVSGAEVVLGDGSLADAVRASMSIPGFFAPVVLEDQMLVDGGMANNLPVSVVREMGADIVIAVDISSPLLTREELDSVLTVTEQLTNFLTRKNTELQIASLGPRDILLVPELEDFGATDFDKVLSIVPVGYESAMVSKAAMVGLSQPAIDGIPAQRQALSQQQAEYIVQFVEINNSSVLNNEIIRSRLDVNLGEPLDYDRLEASISYIYSMDVFQTVTYNLVRNESGQTGIEINAIPRSWGPNYLQFGLQFSDDFSGNSDYQIGMAYTRSALNSLAGELRIDLNFGRNGLLELDFYQPIDQRARWFIEPRAAWSRRVINVYDDDEFRAQVEVSGLGAAFGLGRNFDTENLLRLDYEFYRGKADILIGDSSLLSDDDVDLGELVLQYQHDSLDDLWFPGSGQLVRAAARFAMDELGASSDYQQAYLGGLLAYSWGKNSGQLNYQAGYSFEDAVPIERWYELGGFGRLSGLAPNQLAGRQMGLLTLAMYRRLNDVEVFPVYAGFTLETGNVWRVQSEVSFDTLRYSGSVFLGANTPIGPLYVAYGKSDNGDGAVYFYLGSPWKFARY